MAYHCCRHVATGLKFGSFALGTSQCIKTNIGIVSQVRTATKHWNQKFRKLRAQKVVEVELPDFEEINKRSEDMTEDEMRSKMKEKGIYPARPWMERPIYFSCTGGIFEPYVPPEGDGKVSRISKAGAKQALQFLEKKSKSMLAIRKLRKFEDEFEVDDFLIEAKEIYVKAHEAMVEKDEDLILKYATERVYPEMQHNIKDKTMRWKMLGEVEAPRLVHARSTDIISKDNVFTQLTVRFHTQQTLTIYDRFGRLMYGSEILAKDVLEYVVFEKHLSNKYGIWRLHGKIIPDWMPPKEGTPRTYRMPLPSPTHQIAENKPDDAPQLVAGENKPGDAPQLAAA